jgi:hypothetical protein
MTDEERADALARFQAQLDAQPPPTEERITRLAKLFGSIRLRMARDRARAPRQPSRSPDTSDGQRDSNALRPPGDAQQDEHGVRSEIVGASETAGQRRAGTP